MNTIQQHVANNNLNQAIDLLRSIYGNTDQIITLKAQLSSLKSDDMCGILTFDEKTVKFAKLRRSILELAKDSPVNPIAPSENKVATVKQIFRNIREDLENMAYVKHSILGYISSLNNVFETKIFSVFGDILNMSDWEDLNSAQQKDRCKKVLEKLSESEEKTVNRMIEFQRKLNGTVSLDESIQSFFNRPTRKSWDELSEQLTNRFSDTTLFGEKVIHAFNGWKTKIQAIEDDEISFAMDFNFDYRLDFGAFLQTNLSPKNFNY